MVDASPPVIPSHEIPWGIRGNSSGRATPTESTHLWVQLLSATVDGESDLVVEVRASPIPSAPGKRTVLDPSWLIHPGVGHAKTPSDGSHGCSRCDHRSGCSAARGPLVDARRSESARRLSGPVTRR